MEWFAFPNDMKSMFAKAYHHGWGFMSKTIA
jgi:hypothetical protein